MLVKIFTPYSKLPVGEFFKFQDEWKTIILLDFRQFYKVGTLTCLHWTGQEAEIVPFSYQQVIQNRAVLF